MSSRTKIVVLHMKEILYTGIFLVLGILLVFLLFFMFHSNKDTVDAVTTMYQSGIYTSTIKLSNATLEVEVVVEDDFIKDISFSNLDEIVTASYPLIEPAMETLAAQIMETQSLENLTYSEDSQYTSQVIIDAIDNALNKATTN